MLLNNVIMHTFLVVFAFIAFFLLICLTIIGTWFGIKVLIYYNSKEFLEYNKQMQQLHQRLLDR